jgi:nucleoside-diphosphate-sugar epimerase
VGDRHLVPRLLARARAGRLRIVGSGRNRVDLVHVENAVDAHLLAETALRNCHLLDDKAAGPRRADSRAFFITNGEPVLLWEWINQLLTALGEPPVTRRISLGAASLAGALGEAAWRILPMSGEPPMTRFIAAELAKNHWFDISAARRDLGYTPRLTMAAGTAELVAWYRRQGAASA